MDAFCVFPSYQNALVRLAQLIVLAAKLNVDFE